MQAQLLADILQDRLIENGIHIEPFELSRRGQVPTILEINSIECRESRAKSTIIVLGINDFRIPVAVTLRN